MSTIQQFKCPICKQVCKYDYVLKSDSEGNGFMKCSCCESLYSPKTEEYIVGTTPLGIHIYMTKLYK
jgi:hypothetical protein